MLQLRPSSCATIVFLAVVAIILAYVAGVMSGRHFIISKQEQPKIQEKAPDADKKKGQILKAEELEFARVLHGVQEKPALQEEKAVSLPVKPEALKQENKTSISGSETDNTASFSNESDIADYVFQMAAFKDEAASDGLRQKLEGYGFRTGLEKNGKMFIVLVRMRGNGQRAAELERVADDLRLGKPVMRLRKITSQ